MNRVRSGISRFVWITLAFLLCWACQREEPVYPMLVETLGVEDVGPTHCVIQGEIIETGAYGIMQHGFVWSELPDPTLQTGSITVLGKRYDRGTYTATIRDLAPSTTYYVKAFATGVGQLAYGSEQTFTTTEPTVPRLHTIPAFIVERYSAVAGGNIYSDGGASVTSRGVRWSTDPDPRQSDLFTVDGTGAGDFESEINNLEPYTQYYFRAYAVNDIGVGYGEKFKFITLWDDAVITDIEGNYYATVQIGDQVWMRENLRTATFPDGNPIPKVETTEGWAALGSGDQALCYYENSQAAFETYGALYTWPAAVNGAVSGSDQGEEVQGVCPDGWHLPGEEAWKDLEIHLGLSRLYADEDGWRGWDEGGMLKQTGLSLWNEPNLMATNGSGFSALPAGFRDADGSFIQTGRFTGFWSATAYANDGAWLRGLHFDRGEILRDVYPRKNGFSVRCIKDSTE